MVYTPKPLPPKKYFIPEVGSKVKIPGDLTFEHGVYSAGHEFTVKQSNSFSVVLQDDEGHLEIVHPFLIELIPV